MIINNIEQFDDFCCANMSVWLHIHYCFLFLILIPISTIAFLLYPFIWELMWRLYFIDHEQIDEEEEVYIEEDNACTLARNFIRIFMTEVKLTFIYIIAALISTYTLNIGSMTQMRLNRWLIEACYAPMSIFILWYLHYVYHSGQHIYIYNSTCYTQFTSIIKLIIFVIVRYMEFYPSSSLNNRSVKLFYRFCNKTDENNIHYYFVQLSLNENKTSIL
jgi:hypothetical protein